MQVNNARKSSQQKNLREKFHKFLMQFQVVLILILKDTLLLHIRAFIGRSMTIKLLYTSRKMLNGLLFMMVMVDLNVLSSSKINFISISLILIGAEMFLLLFAKLLFRQMLNGKKKGITVVVVLW